MRGSIFVAAASVVLGSIVVEASVHNHRHAHEALHRLKRDVATSADNATCGCTTYTTVFYGEPTCKYCR